MAQTKNARYRVHNGVDFDTIHFETSAEQVKMPDGRDVNEAIKSHISEKASMNNRGHVMLSNSITSSSVDHAATSQAVGEVNRRVEVALNDIRTHRNKEVQETGGIHGFEVETGSWTPALRIDNKSGHVAYKYREGEYIRQGRVVIVQFYISLSEVSSAAPSGVVSITGLPFTPSFGGAQMPNTIVPVQWGYISMPSSRHSTIIGRMGYSAITLYCTGDDISITAVRDTGISENTILRGSVSYRTGEI